MLRNTNAILGKIVKKLTSTLGGSGVAGVLAADDANHSLPPPLDQVDAIRIRAFDTVSVAIKRMLQQAHEGTTLMSDDLHRLDCRVVYLIVCHINIVSILQTMRNRFANTDTLLMDKGVCTSYLAILFDMDVFLHKIANDNMGAAMTEDLVMPPSLLVALPNGKSPSYTTGGERTDLVALLSLMTRFWLHEPTADAVVHTSQLQTMSHLVHTLPMTFGTYVAPSSFSHAPTPASGNNNSNSTVPAKTVVGAAGASVPHHEGEMWELGTVKQSKPKLERRMSDLIEMITQHSRQLDSQRYVMSPEKQQREELRSVMKTVDKLTNEGRLDAQRATSAHYEKNQLIGQVESMALSGQLDDQRFELSADKLRDLTVNDLIGVVEQLTAQRLKDQDAVSADERRQVLLNNVADVVEHMRRSSMDDQRFIQGMAANLKMTSSELRSSIDSLPSYVSAGAAVARTAASSSSSSSMKVSPSH